MSEIKFSKDKLLAAIQADIAHMRNTQELALRIDGPPERMTWHHTQILARQIIQWLGVDAAQTLADAIDLEVMSGRGEVIGSGDFDN